jgi:lipoyl(octanoyl) transferase
MVSDIEWIVNDGLVSYEDALRIMEERVEAIINNQARELIWLLEHPPLYTAGTSAQAAELLDPGKLPVFTSGRGGKYTYHGPGQRIVYLMLNLKKRAGANQPDLKKYIYCLEQWIINSLAHFAITATREQGRVGIWVKDKNNKEAKIAAIGIRVRKWITYHGIAINLNPNLDNFNSIIPCGIKEYGVTSMVQLGKKCSFKELDLVLKNNFNEIFN